MGELHGLQWQPRDLAKLFYDHGWRDAVVLCQAVQVCLAESQGYDRAFNDNLDSAGQVLSRDVGLLQINVPASAIGTARETDLYDPVRNAEAARTLFESRGWQPWAAWNSKICFRDTYVKRAVRGVGNFLGERSIAEAADPNAQPRELTNPVLDYTYRLATLKGELSGVRAALVALKVFTDASNDARIQDVIGRVDRAVAETKR